MIVIARGLARSFRALARKCVAGRPRGPAPAVVLESKAGTLTVWAKTDDAVLVHVTSAPADDGRVILPMAVLQAVEGGGNDPVELAVGPKLQGEARWTDRGVPRTQPFDAVRPGKQHRLPELPDGWHPVPNELLAALHECGRTTARAAGGRFGLNRVQVKGTAGQVIGTDGHTALVWRGIVLPFAEDVLIPALPVFGGREFAATMAVCLGRTAAHLVVAAGPWRVFLTVDTSARYPDVAGVIPRNADCVAGIDERDAAELLEALPALAGDGDGCPPVTLDLDGGVTVRTRDETAGRVRQVRLERSPSAGPPVRVAVDRRALARALTHGCITIRVAPGKVVAFEGRDKTLIAVALDPDTIVAPPEATSVIGTTDTMPDTQERSSPMKDHETNGRPPNGRHDPPGAEPPDPLAAAEELRAALADALGKAGRLVAALKHKQKEKRALAGVWTSLKALNLGPGSQP